MDVNEMPMILAVYIADAIKRWGIAMQEMATRAGERKKQPWRPKAVIQYEQAALKAKRKQPWKRGIG